MPIELNTLRNLATRYRHVRESERTLAYERDRWTYTAFLSHSHHDSEYAKGLQVLLRMYGWDLYLDWQDTDMPYKPNRHTANRIKNRIETSRWFLFLATANSMGSRWCPWEIGFADGVKEIDDILIVPTRTDNTWYGNEYLGLYRRVDMTGRGPFAFQPNKNYGVPVESLRG